LEKIKPNVSQPTMLEEFHTHVDKVREEKRRLQDAGIYINYVRPLIFQGKKIWAVGNRIYGRPPDETFHEFIINLLSGTLGKEWWDLHVASTEKHFMMKCFLKYAEWRQRSASYAKRETPQVWSAPPDGWTRSLIALAFDVVTLAHAQRLPDTILKRLRNKDQYQGARYEIAIAAIFARLDCQIEFLDDKEKSSTHCEFIAYHRPSKIRIAVEVKSRHRPGAIHTPGIAEEEKLLRGDIGRLLREALQQNPGNLPFLVFIDLNSPLTPNLEMQNKPWFKDIREILDQYETPTLERPDSWTGLFLTNYSYHYQTEKEADSGERLAVLPLFATHPLPFNFLGMLNRALSSYGNVPNLDIETNTT